MAQRLRVLLVSLSFVFCLVQARGAHAQVAGATPSAPEQSYAPFKVPPVKLRLHPMSAGQQGKLFAAGFGGALLGAATSVATGALVGYALSCDSCGNDDEDDPNLGAAIGGMMVAGISSLVTIPLGTALAEQAVSRRMGYRTGMGKSVGGAFLGMGLGAGASYGIYRALDNAQASDGVAIGVSIAAGLTIVALTSSLFHRLERHNVQAAPTLAPTAQGGFTAGVAGRF